MLQASEDEAAAVAQRLGVDDGQRVDALRQHLHRGDGFQACQCRAQAEVDAVAERDVAVQPFAIRVEGLGIVEDPVVVIG